MAARLGLPQKHYKVPSGKKLRLSAFYFGGKDTIIWSSPDGLIERDGMFNTPEVDVDTTFTVSAQLMNNDREKGEVEIEVMKKIEKPEVPERPKSKSAAIEAIGCQGQYSIKIQVQDPKKITVVFAEILLPGWVSILPGGQREHRQETNDNGLLTLPLTNFTEEHRAIDIHVEGMDSDEDKKLYFTGPMKIRCPECLSDEWNGVSCLACNYPNY